MADRKSKETFTSTQIHSSKLEKIKILTECFKIRPLFEHLQKKVQRTAKVNIYLWMCRLFHTKTTTAVSRHSKKAQKMGYKIFFSLTPKKLFATLTNKVAKFILWKNYQILERVATFFEIGQHFSEIGQHWVSNKKL